MATKRKTSHEIDLIGKVGARLSERDIPAYSEVASDQAPISPQFLARADASFVSDALTDGETAISTPLSRALDESQLNQVRFLLHNKGIYDYNSAVLKDYIPKESEFEEDISNLTQAERRFLHAVAKAMIVERNEVKPDFPQLAYQVADLSYSGRLSEWFSRAADLAKQPPARMPRSWEPDSGEPPAVAVLDIFGFWMDQGRMHQGIVHSLSENLYSAYNSRRRSPRSMGDQELAAQREVEAKLPTKKDFNSVLLSGPLPNDPVERARLRRVKSDRGIK